MKDYDLEAVYDEQIEPLMAQILAICKQHRMPMFASFAYQGTADGRWSTCDSHLLYDDVNPEAAADYRRCFEVVRSRHAPLVALTIITPDPAPADGGGKGA